MTKEEARGSFKDPLSLRARLGLPLQRSLSRRLLVLTVLFVMLSEILIFVPSIANFRKTWLEQNLGAAQIAALALEATPDRSVPPSLQQELLENAQVLAVSLHRDTTHHLILSEKMPPRVDAAYDLRGAMAPMLILDAFHTLAVGDGRIIKVRGYPRFGAGDFIEIVIEETPLRHAMIDYGLNIFLLSIVISIVTAGLVFLVLLVVLVRPMRRLTENMVAFRRDPQDASRIITRSSREDEIGIAERELAAMQREIRATLSQRSHLAALGAAVSKINHDLRNILANVQLISDRIGAVDDPTIRHLTPRLFASIDMAIKLCTRTLRFANADEELPHRTRFFLSPLVDEVGEAAGLTERVRWVNDIEPDFSIEADRDQLFRILLNLGQNSVQAILDGAAGEGEVRIEAQSADGHVDIDVVDTGPGLPEKAKLHLFEAFSGSARSGGTGLGLPIAEELARGHGGHIKLLRNGETGAHFRVSIPQQNVAKDGDRAGVAE